MNWIWVMLTMGIFQRWGMGGVNWFVPRLSGHPYLQGPQHGCYIEMIYWIPFQLRHLVAKCLISVVQQECLELKMYVLFCPNKPGVEWNKCAKLGTGHMTQKFLFFLVVRNEVWTKIDVIKTGGGGEAASFWIQFLHCNDYKCPHCLKYYDFFCSL